MMPPMVLEPYYDELYFRQLYTDGALTGPALTNLMSHSRQLQLESGGQVNQTAALEISWVPVLARMARIRPLSSVGDQAILSCVRVQSFCCVLGK